MSHTDEDREQGIAKPIQIDGEKLLPSEPRLEPEPLGLPADLAHRVAAFLPPNETALTFRLVHKATAAVAAEMNTVRLSQPVPKATFQRRLREPGLQDKGQVRTSDQRSKLLQLICTSGVVANIAATIAATRVQPRPEDMAAAAGGGHLAAVRWLRRQGCPWDGSVQEAAAAGGHTEVVAWLAGAGCPWAGGSPMSAAMRAGKYDTVRQLLDLGCPEDFEIYQLAARRGQKGVVQTLLSRRGLTTGKLSAILVGAAAGYPLPDLQDILPRLAARYATTIGNSVSIAQAEQLLLGSPPDGVVLGAAAAGAARLTNGCSAAPDLFVQYAGSEWQTKVLWLVQEKGLRQVAEWDGGHKDEDGFPLMGAAEQARRLQWLRQRGFKVMRVSTPEARRRRHSAMDRAVRGGDVVEFRRLLARHAEFGHKPESGRSWGYLAAERGYVAVVEELLAHGAVTLRDAAHGAAAGGRLRLLSRLLGPAEGVGERSVNEGGGGLAFAVSEGRGVQAGVAAGAAAAGGMQCQEALGKVLRVDLFHAAVSADHPSWEVLRWLRDRGCPWDEAVFGAAVCTCGVELVEWMAAEGCPMPDDGSPYVAAAARGSTPMLVCLQKLGCPMGSQPLLYDAVRAGARLEAVQWLDEHGTPAGGTCIQRAWLHILEEEETEGESTRTHAGADLEVWLEERLLALKPSLLDTLACGGACKERDK